MSRIASFSFVTRFALASAAMLSVAGIVLAQMLTAIIERAEGHAAQTAAVAVRLGIATRRMRTPTRRWWV